MKTEKFDIKGMTCSACVTHVEKSVRKLEGINDVKVNLLTNSMTVSYIDSTLNENKIYNAVKEAGYAAQVQNSGSSKNSNSTARKEAIAMKKRWWYSFLLLIPLMYLSMGPMIQLTLPAFLSNPISMSIIELLLTLPILFLNKNYFSNGFRTLFKGAPTMDSLIAIGSGAAFLYSLYITINIFISGLNHTHDLYFESAATILTLVTLGKYFEAKSKLKTTTALEKLSALAPETAIVLIENSEIETPIEQVKVNDLIVIRSGNQVPVDGIIIEGSAEIDESALTGESISLFKTAGNKVSSGTFCSAGYLIIRATEIGNDTTLARIIQLVDEAANSKAPISRLADKISGIFVPTVILIAISATIIWLFAGYSFSFAFSIGIAILVISCPCALGLATPVAIMVGSGKGAELGLLIKNAVVLENASKTDIIVLDKTGTLTEGKPEVSEVYIHETISETEFISLVYSIEKKSEHILGKAMVNAFEENVKDILAVDNFESIIGKGVKAKINTDIYLIGNEALINDHKIKFDTHKTLFKKLTSEGKTTVFVCKNNQIIGIIALSDMLKPSSLAAVSKLQAMNKQIYMLTGDNKNTADFIAEKTNIKNVISDVLPTDKTQQISNLQNTGLKVAMVGDGINDAPALTKADLGIAIGAGTEIAIDAADVVLMHNSLLDVVNMLELSKATMKNIKQNLFWAFFYNIVSIPVAAGAFYISFGLKLNPMIAAAAMSFSSVTVVLNSLRLLQFKGIAAVTNQTNKQISNKIEFMKLTDGFKLAFNIKGKNDISKTIYISGMTCGHCSGRVEKALNGIEGISATVDLANNKADVMHSNKITDEILRNIVENAGYTVDKIE